MWSPSRGDKRAGSHRPLSGRKGTRANEASSQGHAGVEAGSCHAFRRGRFQTCPCVMSFGNDDHKGRPYEWTVNEPPIRWNPCADGFTNRPYVGVISVRLASLNPPYRSASEPSGDPRPTPVSSALRPNRKACGRLPSPRRQRQPTSPFTRLTNSLSSPRFAPLPADQIPIFDCQHQRQKAKTCTLPIPTQRRFFAPWADEKRSALGDLDWLVGAVRESPLRPRMGRILGIPCWLLGLLAVTQWLSVWSVYCLN